jgi:Lyzozyme M1 (1,4-beta-N-acetylmuramidase)
MAKKRLTKQGKIIILALFALLLFSFWFTTSGPRAYKINMPKGYKVHGIDVSRYQGKINWKELENMSDGRDNVKISFAYLKATEGRSIQDPLFKANWDNIAKSNILRGAYHFFIATRSPQEQAQNFIKHVQLKKGDLPPVLDIEHIGNQSAAKLKENVKIWLTLIENHYGMKPIIYTNIDFYENYLNDKEIRKYPLWIAHYYKKKPKMGEPWIMWQHSDQGEISGIKEKIDFNVFNGSLRDLQSLCKK